ncbi:hypothetical protein J0X19_11815 [Hymenobacter sp. BT186]|uniref:Uncharacterized protein n=1 Tax=Hymenobacter telluris TaxID=2816474 RepID=A0A939EVK3_9BACT|nr:hypothetical protein [Hymenobacter telluris]MBO0358634.1 hypothetical protein [Hymenobacter telluris]MBW3374660.1 hypothetical protein [Hymenobacter norwichensis]
MSDTLGRNTQMVADTKDNVATILQDQKVSTVRMTQFESEIKELTKDHLEVKVTTVDHEKRISNIEEGHRRRKWFIGIMATACGLGSTIVGWLLMHWGAIQEVVRRGPETQ